MLVSDHIPTVHLHVGLTMFHSSTLRYERQHRKLRFLVILFCSYDDSSEPVSSTSSKLVDNGSSTQEVNKPARNRRVLAKSQDLRRHQSKLLIAIEGRKLEDTECSAVVCQACTEVCSRHKRLNL